MKRITYWLAITISLCWLSPALAIVNLESLHLGEPVSGFSGRLQLGMNGAAGNSDRLRINAGTRLQWHQAKTTRFLVANYAYGESFGREDQNKTFVHTRQILGLTQRRAWELFGQIENDKFARLNFRGLLGSGLRLDLLPDNNKGAVFLGLGGFYSEEELAKSGGLEDQGRDRFVRGNFYLVLKYKLSERILLLSTSYWQPVLDDTRDYRLLEDAGLHINLASRLKLALTVDIIHDNRPPLTVKKTDVNYRSSIEYVF